MCSTDTYEHFRSSREGGGIVHGMRVYNQKHNATRMTDQPAQEWPEYRYRKTVSKDHERQLAPIRRCRDDVAAKALARAVNDGLLSPPAVGAHCVVLRAQPYLIAPINHAPLAP